MGKQKLTCTIEGNELVVRLSLNEWQRFVRDSGVLTNQCLLDWVNEAREALVEAVSVGPMYVGGVIFERWLAAVGVTEEDIGCEESALAPQVERYMREQSGDCWFNYGGGLSDGAIAAAVEDAKAIEDAVQRRDLAALRRGPRRMLAYKDEYLVVLGGAPYWLGESLRTLHDAP